MSHYWCEHCNEEFKTNSEEDFIGYPNCLGILKADESSESIETGDDWAVIPIGGRLKDHWILCSYYKERGIFEITSSWMIYKNCLRKINLSDFQYQVACDGLSGL